MAWQPEVGSGTARATTRRDLLNKLVQFACSQHVATVVVNAAGTGYVVGDVVTLTHASAHLDARFEVTSVGGSGEITGLRIVASGAFAQQATSATVSAGGSGYAVGDILQVQGGSSRLPAKFKVATLSGSAVATVTLFEGGGVYSSTPSNPAATVGIGPSTYAGDDAATLTVTYQSIVGTTGLSVTGGTGSGATVDITLAETGWSVVGDSNARLENGVDEEREVILQGDATGKTNKPFVGFITGNATSGVNTRYFIGVYGMAAHNSALSFGNQPGISPGISTADAFQNGPYWLCDENEAQEMDFWFSVDEQRIIGITNINPGAAQTDDGEYMHMHAGYMNPFGTESENPYPLMVGASGRTFNIDPSAGSTNISGLPECITALSASTGWFFYEAEGSQWRVIENGENLQEQTKATIAYPMGELSELNNSFDPDYIVEDGPIEPWKDYSLRTRGSPTRLLYPVLGTVDEFFLWPVNIIQRQGSSTANNPEDGPRGEVRGWFWVSNTDSGGSRVANFAEDFITIGSDRYRVFQNHVHTERYQYIAIKEDV